MAWQDDVNVHEHGIGKGGSIGGATTVSAWTSCLWVLCEGPARTLKIWLDGKLFYDNTSTNPHELTKHTFLLRDYPGDELQMPDPTYAAWVRAHVTPAEAIPAMRGLHYHAAQQIDLQNYGLRLPNFNALVSTNLDVRLVYRDLAFVADTGLSARIAVIPTASRLQTSSWSSTSRRGLCYHASCCRTSSMVQPNSL